MDHTEHLAIIGSGPSAIYLLKHIMDRAAEFRKKLSKISIFDKSNSLGMGMPYSPETTDQFNMSNISSEELPELPISFVEWLRCQSASALEDLGVQNKEISESEVYSRLALGGYFKSQYKSIIDSLAGLGIEFQEYSTCEIVDIHDSAESNRVTLFTSRGESYDCDKVIIASGHSWAEDDNPDVGYYSSPWPISKLLPAKGTYCNCTIGTLGASLSAFDVVSTMAHRHGEFVEGNDGMIFQSFPQTDKFRIVMHAAHGWLPHLQFDQDIPLREIYRHVDRNGFKALLDLYGYLRINTYFDQVCRPALKLAFIKDEMQEMVDLLSDAKTNLVDLIAKIADKHDYENPFEGMRREMVEAKDSVVNHRPTHWKEVIDDLMYTLNFHAELMPAEDHLLFHSEVKPFLMNVMAAMPLSSANILLALYDAGVLDLIPGRVSIDKNDNSDGMTHCTVDDEGRIENLSYRMFVDCSGQKAMALEDYPFQGLVKQGVVRKARALFVAPAMAKTLVGQNKERFLFEDDGNLVYCLGGVDVDGSYRVVGENGKPNPRIFDIAFTHISGVRPYAYGLQACNATSAVLVEAWVMKKTGDLENITVIYEDI